RHRNRVPVATVDVMHDVHIGAPVADIDDSMRRHLPLLLKLIEHGDLAVASRHAFDRLHFARNVVLELGAEDVLRRDDVGQRGGDDLARSGRDDEEREPHGAETALEKLHELANARLQPDALARRDEMLATNAAKLGIVPNQVSELRPLLHEIRPREPFDLLLEVAHAQQIRQHSTGVIEAQRLIEIRSEQVMCLMRARFHLCSPLSTPPCHDRHRHTLPGMDYRECEKSRAKVEKITLAAEWCLSHPSDSMHAHCWRITLRAYEATLARSAPKFIRMS